MNCACFQRPRECPPSFFYPRLQHRSVSNDMRLCSLCHRHICNFPFEHPNTLNIICLRAMIHAGACSHQPSDFFIHFDDFRLKGRAKSAFLSDEQEELMDIKEEKMEQDEEEAQAAMSTFAGASSIDSLNPTFPISCSLHTAFYCIRRPVLSTVAPSCCTNAR